MIHFVDQAITEFLRTVVPLDANDVDISFNAPDRTWGAGLTQPTVNVFLWDVRRDAKRARAGLARTEETDGRTTRHFAPHAVDLRYLITTWGSGGHRDEHALLGAVLTALLQHPRLDDGLVPAALAPMLARSATLSTATAQGDNNQELWRALDGQLKPGIQLTVALQLQLGEGFEAGPPTQTREIRTTDADRPSRRSTRTYVPPATDDPGAPEGDG